MTKQVSTTHTQPSPSTQRSCASKGNKVRPKIPSAALQEWGRVGWEVLGLAGLLCLLSILPQITASCVLDLETKEALLKEE